MQPGPQTHLSASHLFLKSQGCVDLAEEAEEVFPVLPRGDPRGSASPQPHSGRGGRWPWC